MIHVTTPRPRLPRAGSRWQIGHRIWVVRAVLWDGTGHTVECERGRAAVERWPLAEFLAVAEPRG